MSRTVMRYIALRWFTQMSVQMLAVTVSFEMFQVTGSPLWLGFVGLAQFAPKIIFLVLTGVVADSKDRRYVTAFSQSLILIVCIILVITTVSGVNSGPILLVLVFCYGTAFAFQGPSVASLLPNLVSKEDFPSATAKVSTVQQLSIIFGPTLAGILLTMGPVVSYNVITCFNLITIILAISIRKRHIKKTVGDSNIPDSPLEGFRYIWRKKGLFGALSLDMFAVLFGGAQALLPIFALEILGVDSVGFGLLRTSPAIGGVLMAVWLAKRPIRSKTGKTMFICVFLWGVFTIIFAISQNIVLSMAMLILMGAVDMISMVIRSTYVQVTTDDAVRGRVNAVNTVFIGASNQLGEFESGVVASLMGTVPAVVLGGFLTLTVTAAWYALFPDLRKLDKIE